MASIMLSLAFLLTARSEPAMDGPTVFALLQRYHSSFRDVSFIHEGKLEYTDAGSAKPDSARRFQTFYAYRSDGATLLDLFSEQAGKPKGRTITSILHGRVERLDATPDRDNPLRARKPETGPGGPGSLGGTNSPERIFLAWYFPTLGEPAEHDFKVLGWEDVDGHRCLKVSLLRQPKKLLQGWHGSLPYIRLWIDQQRDGYPVRYEFYRGDDLHIRGEITRMERVQVPEGRAIWFPTQGKVWGFVGPHGLAVHKEPAYTDTHGVLIHTVKFNQGLKDSFFSVKKHALVASDEDLRKLQRKWKARRLARKKRSFKSILRAIANGSTSHSRRRTARLSNSKRHPRRGRASDGREPSTVVSARLAWSCWVSPGSGTGGADEAEMGQPHGIGWRGRSELAGHGPRR